MFHYGEGRWTPCQYAGVALEAGRKRRSLPERLKSSFARPVLCRFLPPQAPEESCEFEPAKQGVSRPEPQVPAEARALAKRIPFSAGHPFLFKVKHYILPLCLRLPGPYISRAQPQDSRNTPIWFTSNQLLLLFPILCVPSAHD